MNSIAIMQPYFLPYIGYFQLINAVDEFVVYDNIQYTKKGWINRNKFLCNGKEFPFSIPVKKDKEYLDVLDRRVAESFDKLKLLNQIKNSYLKSPHFYEVFDLMDEIINYEDTNLFNYIFNSIEKICNYLEISTNLIISSEIEIDHSLRSEDKVISIVKKLDGKTYINPEGGIDLYSSDNFDSQNLSLKFLSNINLEYRQLKNEFIPNLSIIDLLFFVSKQEIKDRYIHSFQIL